MTNQARTRKASKALRFACLPLNFGIRSSFAIRHSSFVICGWIHFCNSLFLCLCLTTEERKNFSLRVRQSGRACFSPNGANSAPSPGGEGRGEGEERV